MYVSNARASFSLPTPMCMSYMYVSNPRRYDLFGLKIEFKGMEFE